MPLSFDHAEKMEGYLAILQDRSWNICLTRGDEHPLSDDELDDIARQCLEIADAAQAIEILCARVVRGARQQEDRQDAARDRSPDRG